MSALALKKQLTVFTIYLAIGRCWPDLDNTILRFQLRYFQVCYNTMLSGDSHLTGMPVSAVCEYGVGTETAEHFLCCTLLPIQTG